MKFVTVEQFKEQPIEVQEVFIDWWKCEPFDIYAWSYNLGKSWGIESCESQEQLKAINEAKDYEFLIPLLTEGQLREFIENKTGGTLVASCNIIGNRLISVIKKDNILDGFKTIKRTSFKEDIDLLEAYWKLACVIAKEVIE